MAQSNLDYITVDYSNIDDMEYAIFTTDHRPLGSSKTITTVSIVNITLEKLKCDLLKAKLKSKYSQYSD